MRSTTLRTLALAFAVIVMALAGEWLLAAVYGEDEVSCRQTSLPAPLPALPEASGLAGSRTTPGLLWSLNDSGEPQLVGLNEAGDVKARARIPGATVVDWEDVSSARCSGGACLYVADIGDNGRHRDRIRLYRLPEPVPGESTAANPEVFDAKYPDGPHDAEASFVSADGSVYLITKETPAVIFRFPRLEAGQVVTLERVTSLPVPKVTDAETSPDGRWVAVRNAEELVFYRTPELLMGDIEHGAAVKVNDYGEPQGEGVAFGDNGAVYLAGEGGGRHAPGTLLSLQCSFPEGT